MISSVAPPLGEKNTLISGKQGKLIIKIKDKLKSKDKEISLLFIFLLLIHP